jgi:hypothetical protein
MTKIYLVTYNTDIYFNKPIFHNFITSLYPNFISDWWHYTESAYLIASSHSVNDIYNKIFPGVPGRNLLVIEVDPNNSQGWLPQVAWDWIKKYQASKIN